jgi:hypothetical protein
MKQYIKNNLTPILIGFNTGLIISVIIDKIHNLIVYWGIFHNK